MKNKIKKFFDENDQDEEVISTYEEPKRKIDEMLFHGSGAFSEVMWKIVMRRLDEGHSILCGLQQGGDKKEQKQGEEWIKDVIRDVLASFGYSDAGLKFRKLPYLKRKRPTLNDLSLKHELDTFYKDKIGGPNGDHWIKYKNREEFQRFRAWLDNKNYDEDI